MVIAGIALLIIAAGYLLSASPANPVYYITDNSKEFIQPVGWKGTPVDAKGRFINDEYPFYQNFLHILVWLPEHLYNLVKNRHIKFPVTHHLDIDFLEKDDIIIWLGHASFFLRMNGINILIDPNFYNTSIYRRHTDNPVEPNFFKGIDYILLSHDHADHCDKRSLQLLMKNNPGVTILCGLQMDKLVQSFTKQKVNIITALWYQQFKIAGSIKIYFVPSRHYSKRIFKKFNSTLWGGFVIKYINIEGTQAVYFSGDSGYGSHFKTIKELFNPRIAILPIAAYKPRWLMEPNHMSPEETLQAFKDCGAGKLIPMHYSTFNLSNENLSEPLERIKEIIDEKSLIYGKPGTELML